MIKGNHVYTLNYNLSSLEQKMDVKPEFYVRANSDYHIGEEKKDQQFKMISHIDDLLALVNAIAIEYKGVVRKDQPDKVVLNLIFKNDKLIELLYQLKDAGYDPSIKYEGGKLTHIWLTLQIKCKLKVCIAIRTQQLAISNNDGECDVSSAEIYNNMSAAMNTFNNAVFKSEHKSYYSKQDIDILDEYRTIVPIGLFNEVVDDLVELDVSKAFTYAFTQIVEIPIFNEFDGFTM